jgi:hypothetical protein
VITLAGRLDPPRVEKMPCHVLLRSASCSVATLALRERAIPAIIASIWPIGLPDQE